MYGSGREGGSTICLHHRSSLFSSSASAAVKGRPMSSSIHKFSTVVGSKSRCGFLSAAYLYIYFEAPVKFAVSPGALPTNFSPVKDKGRRRLHTPYLLPDLVTKKIIGRGHKRDGLYILDMELPSSVACTGIITPMEAHCRLGHPSLSSLKKLCPQLSKLSSLDCESYQFAKFHRVSLSPRVNKRASAPFELVHSDVCGVLVLFHPNLDFVILSLLLMIILV